MQNNKFSSPQRMSHSAIPVIYVNLLKSQYQELIAFVIILFIGNDDITTFQKILYPVLAIVLYMLYVGIWTYFKYHFFKFHVNGDNLVVNRGVFHKETLNIPTYKIHSLRTKSGFFYRLFDMQGVSFDTLASKSKEVELILDDADWNALLSMVKDDSPAAEVKENENSVKQDITDNFDVTINYENSSLIKGAFCQNHLRGTLVLATAMAAIIGQIDISLLEQAAVYATDHVKFLSVTITSGVLMLLGVYFVSLLLWLGKIMLRYYNMRLNVSTDKLYFESGLITRRSVRFAYDKVCTLIVKTNPLERYFKCSTVTLKQAFNISDEKLGSDVLVYGCTLASNFLQWWLGNDYRCSTTIAESRSGFGLFWYTVKFPILWSVTGTLLLIYYEMPLLISIVVIYLAFRAFNAFLTFRRSKIELKDDYLIITTGGYAEKLNYLKYSNVEQVTIKSTPMTRWYHRVHLSINTNGTTFKIRSLKQDEALLVYDLILAAGCKQ